MPVAFLADSKILIAAFSEERTPSHPLDRRDLASIGEEQDSGKKVVCCRGCESSKDINPANTSGFFVVLGERARPVGLANYNSLHMKMTPAARTMTGIARELREAWD